MRRFVGDVNIRQLIVHSRFEPGYKVLNNSTPGEMVYIWQIEQVQINAKKFERTQI